jgi:hypothetical protein
MNPLVNRLRLLTVHEKTFGLSLRVQVAGSIKSSIRNCILFAGAEPDFGSDNNGDHPFGWALINGCYGYIWLEQWPEDEPNSGALVHEITHIVHGFLRHIGESGEETRAYLTQFLYRELNRKLNTDKQPTYITMATSTKSKKTKAPRRRKNPAISYEDNTSFFAEALTVRSRFVLAWMLIKGALLVLIRGRALV